MLKYSIYKIDNTVDDKLYVGSTTNHFEARFHEHILHALNRNNDLRGSCFALHSAMRTYGVDSFSVSLLERSEGDKQVMFSREYHWVRTLNCLSPHGYNMRVRGLSDEQIAIVRFNACNLSNRAYAQLFGVLGVTIGVAKTGRGNNYTSDPYKYITRDHLPANVDEYMEQFKRSK